MKYIATVYIWNGGYEVVGDLEATTSTELKRKASVICNGYFSTIDKIEVEVVDELFPQSPTTILYRHNTKHPNNTIKRGKWR